MRFAIRRTLIAFRTKKSVKASKRSACNLSPPTSSAARTGRRYCRAASSSASPSRALCSTGPTGCSSTRRRRRCPRRTRPRSTGYCVSACPARRWFPSATARAWRSTTRSASPGAATAYLPFSNTLSGRAAPRLARLDAQRLPQGLAGVACLVRRNLLRRPLGDEAAAAVAAFRAEVDDPVGGLNDIDVVLDHHHRVAGVAQSMQHFEQQLDVVEMQACGRLVEDVQRAPGVALRELERQLHALRLAARERRRRLAQPHVAQADVDQRLQLSGDRRNRGEEAGRLAHGHLQHFVDVAALVAHLQRLAVVALAVAHVAGDVDVGQEVHLDLGDAIALAGLATAALDVE